MLIDRDQIERFATTAFAKATIGTYVALRAFGEVIKATALTERWSSPVVGSDLTEIATQAAKLAALAAAAPEPVLFAAPLCTFKTADSTAERNVADGLVISLEIDERPERGRERAEDILGPGSLVVASGGQWIDPETGEVQPKLHLHWLLTEPASGFRALLHLHEARRRLAVLLGGDPTGVPTSHCFRWPGSLHRKAMPALCSIIEYRPDVTIDLDAAFDRIAAAEQAAPPAERPERVIHVPRQLPGGLGADLEDVAAALDVIPNADRDPRADRGRQFAWWSRIMMAIFATSHGSDTGRELALAWCEKSNIHTPEGFAARWQNMTASPPTKLGFGTLFYEARRVDRRWLKPSTRRLEPPVVDADGQPLDSEPETLEEPVRPSDAAVAFINDDPGPPSSTAASFRDPWATPPQPEWPADVLPVIYNDMIFETAMSAGLDPGAQALATLCAISGAACKSTRLYPHGRSENWWVPPLIWGMVVAPVGYRKTALETPFEALLAIDDIASKNWHIELAEYYGLSRQQQAKTPKPPEPHWHVVTDTSPERVQLVLGRTLRGALYKRDELAGFFAFGRYGNDTKGAAERAFYLESYEARTYSVFRIGRDTLHIAVNGLTIFGSTQPTRLTQFRGLEDDGLLQRFITVCAIPPSLGRKLGAISGKAAFDAVIDRLTVEPGREYQSTPGGSEIIRRMEALALDLSALTDYGPGFAGFCGKLHGTLARLALILHLLDDPGASRSVPIPTSAIERADRLVREFVLPHVRNFYATLSPEPLDLVRSIAAWLLTDAPTRITASDFGKHVRVCRGLSLAQLNTALDPLVGGGWLHPEIQFPSNRVWMLDPRVRAAMAYRTALAREQRERNRRLAESIGKI